MQVKILGCSGGIGNGLRTTSILLDDDVLIDAGTGVGDLSIDELCKIDHIFVTHSHLDHIASIPFLLDTVMGLRPNPVTLHATIETINTLREHIFNWKIWPDFNVIPDAKTPFLQYQEIAIGQSVTLGDRTITALPANHTVPAVGYRLDSGQNSLVFSGDTTTCDALWEHVNKIENLKYVIIETAFGDGEIALARLSKHLSPSLLIEELKKLKRPAEIYITHLKPGEGEVIMREFEQSQLAIKPDAIKNMQIFEL
ncbi:3',5'-cyclic-nucleotide phosphodiesterase [Methylovorus sp. MM2]|uniref:3',5'-cyclic-nucleotide phosphodiesterase n=1 Tax=Methylovorus sp. MM2 TaxID=1848038 RepID=UPI0007DE9403|nr:3',5'-cyclic-nucleotide phosphodiesterase [Methylovorus sp. MM2]OAM51396.1 3',5'-cyclic-nucleotide phosphodiesterase [Methylovorus sp. MM2]